MSGRGSGFAPSSPNRLRGRASVFLSVPGTKTFPQAFECFGNGCSLRSDHIDELRGGAEVGLAHRIGIHCLEIIYGVFDGLCAFERFPLGRGGVADLLVDLIDMASRWRRRNPENRNIGWGNPTP